MTQQVTGSRTRRSVAVIGALDTKGEAIGYLTECIHQLGLDTIVIDVGILGAPSSRSDISREDVARAGNAELSALIDRADKGHAIAVMTSGAREIIRSLVAAGTVSAALAVGGAQGAAIGSAALQVLPLGIPKLVVTTVASGRNTFEPYVGTSDMMLMHSVTDILGVDRVSRRVLANAAAAVTGMARVDVGPDDEERPAVAATMLGLTTAGLMHMRDVLKAKGFDVVPFHANGTGGRCFEEFIRAGCASAVVDFSTHELVGHMFGGLFDAGPERMKAAPEQGLPHVVVPGGTDYIVLGPLTSLTEAQRGRPLVVHNPNITLIRTTAAEMAQVGEVIATRLNNSAGPTAVVVPLRGFSQVSSDGGPFRDPEADSALIEGLRSTLTPDIDVTCVDTDINSAAFGDVVAEKTLEIAGI